MKKLLSMLGAMLLTGTASTNVFACDGGETPNPKQKTDLSGLPNNVNVTIIENDAKIFKI